MKNIFKISVLFFLFAYFLSSFGVSWAQDIIDGDLIRVEGTFDIFIVKIVGNPLVDFGQVKKFKRLILNPQIFESYGHLRWEDVKDLPQSIVDEYVISNLIIEVNSDGSVANPKIYRVTSAKDSDIGERRWINLAPSEFEVSGFDWDSVYFANHKEADPNFYSTKEPLSYAEISKEKAEELLQEKNGTSSSPQQPEEEIVLRKLTAGDTYTISSEKPPYFTEVGFDPLDYQKGETQTVELKIENETPVERVSVTMITDNYSKTYELELIEGTDKKGIWKGSWVAEDSHDFKYQAALEAESATESSQVVVTFR